MNINEIEMAWKSAEFNDMLLQKLAASVKQFIVDFQRKDVDMNVVWESYENLVNTYDEVMR